MPIVDLATPTIWMNYDTGAFSAQIIQDTGYVNGGVKISRGQLDVQAAKTITPSTSSQTAVASGVYTTGEVTVAAIPNEYITTTDATASANEIMSGETAYVNGSKIIGTFSLDTELSAQDDLISQIQAAVNNLPEAGNSSGGSAETCTVTFWTPNNSTVSYVNNRQVVTEEIQGFTTKNLTVTKNTIMFIHSGWSAMNAQAGSCNKLFYHMSYAAYAINGDCTLIGEDGPS